MLDWNPWDQTLLTAMNRTAREMKYGFDVQHLQGNTEEEHRYNTDPVFALSKPLGIGFETVDLMWGAFTRTYEPRMKITHLRSSEYSDLLPLVQSQVGISRIKLLLLFLRETTKDKNYLIPK